MQTITFEGNLTADPELRHTQAGKPVVKISVAVNTSKKDENGNWAAGTPTFWDKVTIWGTQAENVAASLAKGQTVVVTEGRVETEEWTDRDGNKRHSLAVTVGDRQGHVTPSLRFATAEVTKNAKQNEGGN